MIFSSHQLDLVQRLCHTVGIVSKGRLLALSTVHELRRRDGVQLEVDAPHAAAGWADDLTGVLSATYSSGTVLTLDPTADDQVILRAALATGPVHKFATTTPDLTELYREVVSA